MLVSEQAPTSELTKALSRLAGNRHSDGVSSIVSADDRSVIINGCHEMMIALKSPSPRAQALEALFDAVTLMQKHDEKFEGEIPLATIQKVYAAHTDALRALSSQPVADGVEVIPSSGCVFADMGVERAASPGASE